MKKENMAADIISAVLDHVSCVHKEGESEKEEDSEEFRRDNTIYSIEKGGLEAVQSILNTVPELSDEWKDQTLGLKTVIVNQPPQFVGILFTFNDAPIRKIGLESSKVTIPGQPPMGAVINASAKQAPEYRLVFRNQGATLHTKGLPEVFLQ